MTREKELSEKSAKELVEIATELQIVGRGKMNKGQLISAIIEAQSVADVDYGDDLEGDESETSYDDSFQDVEATVDSAFDDFENEMAMHAQETENSWEDVPRFVKRIDEKIARPKAEFINNATVGTIVAFPISETRALSGKIISIRKNEFEIQTKNSNRYLVTKNNILWVKTGPRWPNGIYAMFKGESVADGQGA